MTHAARIRRARMLTGLSQAELAAKLDLSRSAISQWERFTGTKPNIEHLGLLATLCKVQFEWLSTGRGPMKLGDTHQEPAAHMAEFGVVQDKVAEFGALLDEVHVGEAGHLVMEAAKTDEVAQDHA